VAESPVTASDDAPALRRLAQLSIAFAVLSLMATFVALMRLPNAQVRGQWILVGVGCAVSIAAFVFGMTITLRKPLARPAGFVIVALTVIAAALFSLLAAVAAESAFIFSVWTIVLLGYAALTTHRLVRWPTGDLWDQPKSSLWVFISYRRDDSREITERIHDRLQDAFEEQNLFLDVDRQAPGEDYRAVVSRALERADAVLAVIGPRWLAITGHDAKRRLDDPEDMVRIELQTAFQFNLRVIPVLVGGATMPAPADVPPPLQPLCYRTAVPVRPDPDFTADMQRLMAALRSEPSQPAGVGV
jgi:hypothetical protein